MTPMEERMEAFIQRVHAVANAMSPVPPAGLIDDFVDYWTEHNVGGKKMAFEKQKTFNEGRRLRTWIRYDKKWNGTNSNNTTTSKELNSFLYGKARD